MHVSINFISIILKTEKKANKQKKEKTRCLADVQWMLISLE